MNIMSSVWCFVLALLSLAAVSLQKTYLATPAPELKRRALAGDVLAKALHRAVSYGVSLPIVLWGLVGLTQASLFIFIARTLWAPLSLVLIVIWLCLSFGWLVRTSVSAWELSFARAMAPALASIIGLVHPLLERVGKFLQRHLPLNHHTRIYSQEDLIALLEAQARQADNRISHAQLQITLHALTFGDKLVRDFLTPLRQVIAVNQDETVGPLLMNALHNSGHSRFPVYGSGPSDIVGTLHMRDLARSRAEGQVKAIMRPDVFYIHDEQSLYQALAASLKTKHHLFIVVNSFEEMVGLITIEDVLEQVIGQPIVDEFDQYENLRKVAAQTAAQIHKSQNHHTYS